MALGQVEMPVGNLRSCNVTVLLGCVEPGLTAGVWGARGTVAASVQAPLTDAQSALRLLARESKGIRIEKATTHAALKAKIRK